MPFYPFSLVPAINGDHLKALGTKAVPIMLSTWVVAKYPPFLPCNGMINEAKAIFPCVIIAT